MPTISNRVYKIRLNPSDAKYGLDTKERRKKRQQESGFAFSQESLDNWKRACDSTAAAILSSLPKQMQDAIVAMRKTLPQTRPDARCVRCNGRGHREDKQHWVVVEEKIHGKICFKCNGSGIEPCAEPVFFRRRAVDTLRNSIVFAARLWANKVLNSVDNPYYAVLSDIANAIMDHQDFTKLPH